MFGLRDCLGINVHSGPHRVMPLQLLDDFELRPDAPQQSRVRVSESMSPDSFLDSERLRAGTDIPPHE